MNTWAVVTSFRPGDGLQSIVGDLLAQVEAVVVVDDGSGEDADAALERARDLGANVVRLEDNLGIAAALNAGITHALDAGADAIVTFDQDSHIAPGFVAELVSTLERGARDHPIPGPVVPEFFAGVRQARRDTHGRLVARGPIQSGMLVSRSLLESVGLMDVDLFIDLVDTEFELRCIARGFPVLVAPGLRLEHELGARYRAARGPLSLLPALTLSAPFRYYYRMRNRIELERRYGRRFPIRLAKDGIVDRLHFLVALSLARPRRDLWLILRDASRAGRRRVGGRIPHSLEKLSQRITWAAARV